MSGATCSASAPCCTTSWRGRLRAPRLRTPFQSAPGRRSIERWTRFNEGNLRNEVTIEDPGAFSRPFVTTWMARLAPPGDEIMENICQENNQYGIAGGHQNPFLK